MELVTLPLNKIKPYERNPRNNNKAVDADVIINRWENLTGKKAVLINEMV